jgi:hypothetical protein
VWLFRRPDGAVLSQPLVPGTALASQIARRFVDLAEVSADPVAVTRWCISDPPKQMRSEDAARRAFAEVLHEQIKIVDERILRAQRERDQLAALRDRALYGVGGSDA